MKKFIFACSLFAGLLVFSNADQANAQWFTGRTNGVYYYHPQPIYYRSNWPAYYGSYTYVPQYYYPRQSQRYYWRNGRYSTIPPSGNGSLLSGRFLTD